MLQPAADPLRGEYGFLTEFHILSSATIRERVDQMVSWFGILEFQFYDAFSSYSAPPVDGLEQWAAPFDHQVSRSTLEEYAREIASRGGRSWFYVQIMATDVGDTEMQQGFTVLGSHAGILDIVVPTAAWAERIAPQWARFVASLGFSGIHWDTLGDLHNGLVTKSGADVPGFLRAALPHLRKEGLAQTCNFVDGFGWDRSLLGRTGWANSILAFPYWEIWNLPSVEDRFFTETLGGGVFVCYPGRAANHSGEWHNWQVVGLEPVQVLIGRWRKARCHGSTYLAIGDGHKRLQMEYFPDKTSLSSEEVALIREGVFGGDGLPRECLYGSSAGGKVFGLFYALFFFAGLIVGMVGLYATLCLWRRRCAKRGCGILLRRFHKPSCRRARASNANAHSRDTFEARSGASGVTAPSIELAHKGDDIHTGYACSSLEVQSFECAVDNEGDARQG